MESGDASNEEAPPCDPKSNNLTQKELSKAISMVVDMETEDGLKRHAIMVVAKKIRLTHADLLYYECKNIPLLLCTPMVLIYNSELGIIISSDFFMQRNSRRSIIYSLVFLFNFFRGVVGGYHMKYLGNLFFILIYRLRLQNHQPNSGTKSM